MWPGPLTAAPTPVRFVEGVSHDFLVLRTLKGELIAPGELLQITRGIDADSRMVFHFKDGSVFDETVIFSQDRVFTMQVFTMQSYHLVQRGPLFPEDTEVYLERRSSGTIIVKKTCPLFTENCLTEGSR